MSIGEHDIFTPPAVINSVVPIIVENAMTAIESNFEQSLQENLTLYLHQDIDEANIFQANREISIARYALTQQAESYFKAIQILNKFLEVANLNSGNAIDKNILTNVMTAIATIESKSKSLIETVHQVTRLIKDASTIDIDKSALRTIVVNIPVLVKQSISRISGDDQLAESVSLNLNNSISELMTACRLDRDQLLPSTSTNMQEKGINAEQFVDLFNSVPSQPRAGELLM